MVDFIHSQPRWRWIWILGICCLLLTPNPTLAQAIPPVVITTPTSPPPPTPTPKATPTATPNPTLPRSYQVQPGDTLLDAAVALGRGLEEMNCVVGPNFVWTDPLVVGDWLQTPPAGTLCHGVQPGESLADIAAQYGVTSDSIREIPWNRLSGDARPGTFLRIQPPTSTRTDQSILSPIGPVNDHPLFDLLQRPVTRSGLPAIGGAQQPLVLPPDWPYGSGRLAWPLYGWLTQSYHNEHRGVDLSAQAGTLITASDRGEVIRAGWNTQGYGNIVIIDHHIDYFTLYGHLDEILVTEGQIVAQGQAIGTVGSTGNSTGPHLHFEVWDFGIPVDPLRVLGR